MESARSSSFGRASEALTRTYSNSPEKYNLPLRTLPSLQPRSSPLYSPDTRVFSTPEHGGILPARDEFPVHRGSARGEPEQAFQDHMDQYAVEQLSKEWDGLFLGDGSDDLRNGADVYRELRKDLRSLACALKQSFGLVVDNRLYSSSGGAPPGRVQQLQPCIAELKSVAKEMASATRMANDNYNLQVELTLQKHASQHLLAQLHEAQLARMAMEEEINSLRAETQRVTATESTVAHLRRLNDELQAEAQQASGELVDMRRRARELEGRLEEARAHAEQLAARLREAELVEDLGSHAQLRDLCGSSSDGGASDGAGSRGSAQQQHEQQHALVATAANGSATAEGGAGDGAVHGQGGRSQAAARDLPPELRCVLGKLLRRRDAESAKLREENALMADELKRLRDALAAATSSSGGGGTEGRRHAPAERVGAGGAASASAPGLMQLDQRPTTPWRLSSDSWHTDDDFDWATRPVARLPDPHSHPHPLSCSQTGEQDQMSQRQPDSRDEQQPQQQELHEQPRQQCLDSRRLQQQQHGHTRQAAQQEEEQRQAAEQASAAVATAKAAAAAADAAAAKAEAELEAARSTIARLTAELSESQERLRSSRAETQAAAAEAEAMLEQRLSEAQAAEAAAARAEAEVRLAATEVMEAQQALAAAMMERDALAAQLDVARRAAEAEVADAHAAAAAAAAESDLARLILENDRMAADLVAVRQLVASLESQLAASASSHADLQGRLSDAEQRERRERQARDGAAKELETARQRLVRLQADMRDVRAEAQVARGEATAASRDVKAANSEKLKAQREMEEAVERLRGVEAERDALAAALSEAEAARRRLEDQLAAEEVMAAAAAAIAEAEAETEAQFAVSNAQPPQDDTSTASGSGEAKKAEEEMEGSQPSSSSVAATAALVSELEAARRELAAAEQQLAQERRISEQEAVRLRSQLDSLQAELEAVRRQMSEAQAASRERVAVLEGQLALADLELAEAREQHRAEAAQQRDCLEDAQCHAEELEAQLAAVQAASVERDAAAAAEAAQASAEAKAEADTRFRVMERQLLAAEVAQREAEQRYDTELAALRSRLAEAEEQAAAAATAVATAPAAVAEPSQGSSASSSDAGVSGGASPERSREDAAAARGAAAATTGEGLEDDGRDDGDDDLVALRARCRALRGELALARSRLAALTDVSEAAAQGRLAEALAEARAAAEAGSVTNDDDFWTRNSEVHSLHALVTALRATCLYAGPAGAAGAAAAAYGETRADGVGSVVAASASQLASARRRRMLHGVRERCGQMAELLSEAEALARLSPPPLHDHSASRSQGCSTSGGGGGSEALHGQQHLHGRHTAHRHSRGGAGGSPLLALGLGGAPRGPSETSPAVLLGQGSDGFMVGLREADGAQYLDYDLDPSGAFDTSEGGAAAAAAAGGGPARSYYANGAGMGGPGGMTSLHHPPPPMASSSFTSGTGSSLADDDLTSLSHLYEIPPMASPPKFDFGDMDFTKLGV